MYVYSTVLQGLKENSIGGKKENYVSKDSHLI